MSDRAIETLELSWPLEATLHNAWTALVFELSNWWPSTMFASEHTKEMVLEPSLGGRLYEDHGNGQGVMWSTVCTVIEEKLIEFAGPVMPRFGGPAYNTISLSLEETDGKVVLHMVSGTIGAQADSATMKEGWNLIFGSFQTYVASRASA